MLLPTIEFATPLEELERTVLRLFDDVAKSLNNVLRVDQRIHLGSMMAGGTRLFEVTQEESEVASMRKELENILKHNLHRPDAPKMSLDVFFQSYDPYQFLLRQRRELPLFFKASLENPGSVTLEDCSKKIQQVSS